MFLSNKLSIKDTIINGTAKPNEYTKSNKVPSPKFACPAAIKSIVPRTVPIQGVQPIDNDIPIKIEPKNPLTFGVLIFDVKLNRFNFTKPSILNPKITIIIPLINLKILIFFEMKLPKADTAPPNIKNMIVNPIIKPIVLVNIKNLPFFVLSSIDTPAIYAIYAGINGSMHGEKNEVIPAKNATENVTSPKLKTSLKYQIIISIIFKHIKLYALY